MNAWIIVTLLLGIGAGAAIAALWLRRKAPEADPADRLREAFRALAAESLKDNNEQFLRLAEENLQRFQQQAKGELEQKEKSIENLVKPINEALKKTTDQIEALERDRRQTHGAISQHLQSMAENQKALQDETRNLVKALRKPEVRGRYGEMSLRRLAELAGMVEHCDFTEQEQTGEGMRPDMVVHMPDNQVIVIDAKTPIAAYLDAIEAEDDAARDAHLVRHARQVRDQVKKLAAKEYWNQFERSPDFVVMYIPGEQFLEPALKHAPDLQDEALRSRVILATPMSLVALLRVVAFGWRQQVLAENAEEIRKLGIDLHKRLSVFAGHLQNVGKHLDRSVDHYNKAVGSFESQLIPGARRFPEMGVDSGKEIAQLDPLDRLTRPMSPVSEDDDAPA